MPKTPPLVFDGNLLASIFGSSSSSEPQPAWASREHGLVSGVAPAASPLPRGSTVAPVVEDKMGRALEFEHERSVIRHELFQEAMGAMKRLGGELKDVDVRLRAEGLGWWRNGIS